MHAFCMCSLQGNAAVDRVILDVAELMCGSAEDAGSQEALQIMLSQTNQYLRQKADGTQMSA